MNIFDFFKYALFYNFTKASQPYSAINNPLLMNRDLKKGPMRTWIKMIFMALLIVQSNAAFPQEFILPAFIDDITSCDIDLDGDVDILCICQILNYDEDSIFIFYNNGAGYLQRMGYRYPNSGFILCGCMDGNEFPDLITRLSFNVFYVPNNGLEGFGEMVTIDDNMGGNLSVISDINNDNWNDLIFSVIDYENWGVYKNNDGLVFTKNIIQSGSPTTMPAVGLITDDSLPDIVLSYSAFNRSSVNINEGNFNFNEVLLAESFMGEAFAMNIDNNGTDDFAFVNYYTKTIPLYKFIGNDQFELQSNFYAEGTYPISSFLTADFNQDGYDDFAITRGDWWNSSDSLYIYLNDNNWSFNLNQILYIGVQTWYKSCAADLNGDSFPDIFMKGCNGSNILTLLWNDGNGNFSFENTVNTYEQIFNDHLLRIFPNPFTTRLKVELNHKIPNDVSITISNIYGSTMKTFIISANELSACQTITWDGYDENNAFCPAGVYIITVRSDSIQLSKKALKY